MTQMTSQPHQTIPSSRQAGFTLIELMVVTAVMGFLILAATGVMVSFTKFKYMADVQEQLKAEATFAANQIDLLLRNSSGIPDLCMTSNQNNSNQTVYCNGLSHYNYVQTPSASNLGSGDYYQESMTELCLDSAQSRRFNSANSRTGLPAELYGYRENSGNPAIRNRRDYIVIQVRREENSCEQAGFSTAFSAKSQAGQLNQCISDNQQRNNSVYYNQVITTKPSSLIAAGDTQYQDQLVVYEFKVGEGYLARANAGTDLERRTLEDYIPLVIDPDETADPSVTSLKEQFLTSNSVDVIKGHDLNDIRISGLEFECQVENYGLPKQAAMVSYELTVQKPKRHLVFGFYEYEDPDSFETYTIQRVVNIRNSSGVFRFEQTAQ